MVAEEPQLRIKPRELTSERKEKKFEKVEEKAPERTNLIKSIGDGSRASRLSKTLTRKYRMREVNE